MVIRVCELKIVRWSKYLQTITGFAKDDFQDSAYKLCTKYLGLIQDNQEKIDRLRIVKIKYGDRAKYNGASGIKPRKISS